MSNFRYWLTVILVFVLIYIVGGVILSYYTDWLWFGEVGYRVVFWKQIVSRVEIGLLAGIVFFLIVLSNVLLARKLAPPVLDRYDADQFRVNVARFVRRFVNLVIFGVPLVLAFFVAIEASTHWFSYQTFANATSFGAKDPIFHNDIKFYVFRLDFLRYIYGWLLFAFVVAGLAAAFVHYTDRAIEFIAGIPTFAAHVKAHLSVILAAILFVRAWGYRLDAYNLLYSPHGFMYGAGYTDVHARLVAYKILSVVAVIAGLIALVNIRRRGITLPAAAIIILIGASLLIGVVYPGIVQQVYVTPNAIPRETKFMEYNISFTRRAFNLDTIKEQPFPATTTLTAADIGNNRATINSIRLWDYRPIQSTYDQLQALGLYYEIKNVDIDRYTIHDELRQVMLAARELSADKIASKAGTWVNQRFQYTHGYGAVMSPVNRATSSGKPEFFVSDMPPISSVGIGITRPQLYYGEEAFNYVVVNSQQKEYDYSTYTSYAGKGGIPIWSYLRRLAFALRFSDVNLMLKNPITPQSRLMFRRQIGERVQAIFPYLLYDGDPYLVISDGKLFWMWDAYTISQRYPYSEPTDIGEGFGINYIRNAVKVVIDAYEGTVDFYIADDTDPIIKTYSRIFPGAFKPLSEMPAGLNEHIRYPELIFRLQTNVLRVYHMTDAHVFYNRGDLWDIPNEIVETSSAEQPVEPYYVVMKLPEEKDEVFIIMRPFTPQNKSNMVAWMAAKCGPKDRGKTILYEFPKDKLIYGPAQIESRINQDTTISEQLTLWNQSGSRVNRGNQLVIPIEKSLIYVKPLYLQSETSEIPELKRVVVAYGEDLAMEPTLDAALARIFGGASAPSPEVGPPTPAAPGPPGKTPAEVRRLINQAIGQYDRAKAAQQKGDWATYGEQVRALEQTLKQLQQTESR